MATRFAIAAALAALTAPCVFGQKPSDTAAKPADQKDQQTVTGQSYIKEYDKNNDGSLSRDELPAGQRDGFNQLDANKDGKLSADELKDHAERMSRAAAPVEVISVWVVEAQADAPSRQELQKAYDVLRKADKNDDGKLAEDELRAAREQAIQQRVDSAFERCDKNNDGKISRDEVKGPTTGYFTAADKNNDGFVTRDELKQCCTPAGDKSGGEKTGGDKPGDKKK
jgi:Ca2+-binding EF-hand superfamily protein